MRDNRTEKRLERMEASLELIKHALGIAPEQLAKAEELAKKLKERRDAEIAAGLEARRVAGIADPEQWTDDDEFRSQMT